MTKKITKKCSSIRRRWRRGQKGGSRRRMMGLFLTGLAASLAAAQQQPTSTATTTISTPIVGMNLTSSGAPIVDMNLISSGAPIVDMNFTSSGAPIVDNLVDVDVPVAATFDQVVQEPMRQKIGMWESITDPNALIKNKIYISNVMNGLREKHLINDEEKNDILTNAKNRIAAVAGSEQYHKEIIDDLQEQFDAGVAVFDKIDDKISEIKNAYNKWRSNKNEKPLIIVLKNLNRQKYDLLFRSESQDSGMYSCIFVLQYDTSILNENYGKIEEFGMGLHDINMESYADGTLLKHKIRDKVAHEFKGDNAMNYEALSGRIANLKIQPSEDIEINESEAMSILSDYVNDKTDTPEQQLIFLKTLATLPPAERVHTLKQMKIESTNNNYYYEQFLLVEAFAFMAAIVGAFLSDLSLRALNRYSRRRRTRRQRMADMEAFLSDLVTLLHEQNPNYNIEQMMVIARKSFMELPAETLEKLQRVISNKKMRRELLLLMISQQQQRFR